MSNTEPSGAAFGVSTDFPGAPLGQLVYERTYSRTKADDTKETWAETVERVVEGNVALVPSGFVEDGEAARLKALLHDRVILPAGRHLWASGVPGRQFLMNCHRAGWGETLSDHFAFMFNELMKGGGVGANYGSQYLAHLPIIKAPVFVRVACWLGHPNRGELGLLVNPAIQQDRPNTTVFTVPDTREGWVDALRKLLDLTQKDEPQTLIVNVSEIRHRGTPIRGFGGTASGPGPLVQALRQIAVILEGRVGHYLDPITAMEIDHAIASCVVSGNVRRSARMSIVPWDDPYVEDFLRLKEKDGAHWSTNISVAVDDGFFEALSHPKGKAQDVLNRIVDGMLRNGEPGVYNLSRAQEGERGDVGSTNPCGEIALEEWEPCNLGHVNLAIGDPATRLEAFRLMARFLVRATFAPVEDPRQGEVLARNRRIGVGFLGLQEYLAHYGIKMSQAGTAPSFRRTLRQWHHVVRTEADAYADQLGIPRPIKVTAVAPTGTISKLAGTTEGIHPVYARHFIRRVRFANNDPAVKGFEEQGYPVEEDLYTPHTAVVSFPCKDPLLDRVMPVFVEQADEIAPEDALALQAVVQTEYADNAVSHTLNVPEGTDPVALREALTQWLPLLKGVTVMVDASRAQAPYERITEEQYLSITTPAVVAQPDMECTNGCPIR